MNNHILHGKWGNLKNNQNKKWTIRTKWWNTLYITTLTVNIIMPREDVSIRKMHYAKKSSPRLPNKPAEQNATVWVWTCIQLKTKGTDDSNSHMVLK